jgi:CRP-like cAMP-binding protein
MTDDELRHNAILAALPEPEFERLRAHLQPTDAQVRDQVYQPDKPIDHLFFPISAVFSLVGTADDNVLVEVATIGREGMVGLPVFLGRPTSPHASFCQVPGRAAVMSAGALRSVLSDDGALHGLLNRFTQATMVQVAQNVVCNGTHPVGQRAARWLLTTHDRVQRDEFPLTQEFLGQMLGARRPTVSETAGKLQAEGLIRYSRGRLTITDRPGLEQVACSCYAIVKAEFDALTGSL